jgi:hemolysin III
MTVTQAAGAVDVARSQMLYDARRGLYYPKPALRGWLSVVWFAASLVGGTVLLTRAHGATQLSAAAIYTTTASGLFGASAVYHRGNWSPSVNRRLQRLDHTMIFLVIAGTATPAFLLAAPNPYGVIGLSALWTLTVVATVTHLAWMSAPEKLVGATFIGLGWTAGMAEPAVWIHGGIPPALLLLAGGVLYTAGALSYHHRRPDPIPAIFGFHEVFHAFVCAAATCQYIAIALLIK